MVKGQDFNHIDKITIGALVMFTKNVNIPKGVVNGATTTITSIVLDPQNNVTSIEVQLTNNSTKMILKKHSFQHKCTYDGYFYKTSFPYY
jgi:hypothetical protein